MKYLFLILFLFLIPLISSENLVEQGDTYYLKVQCIYNGTFCPSGSYCNLTLFYPNSSILLNNEQMTNQFSFYNYSISSTNDLGVYQCSSVCCSGTYCGSSTDCTFEVTTTGNKVSLSNSIIVIVFLIISTILFLVGYNFDKSKWIVKSFFFLSSLLVLILALNSARLIASESLGLSTMANSGFILIISITLVMFLYVFIFWLIETFKIAKDKKGVRWNY